MALSVKENFSFIVKKLPIAFGGNCEGLKGALGFGNSVWGLAGTADCGLGDGSSGDKYLHLSPELSHVRYERRTAGFKRSAYYGGVRYGNAYPFQSSNGKPSIRNSFPVLSSYISANVLFWSAGFRSTSFALRFHGLSSGRNAYAILCCSHSNAISSGVRKDSMSRPCTGCASESARQMTTISSVSVIL